MVDYINYPTHALITFPMSNNSKAKSTLNTSSIPIYSKARELVLQASTMVEFEQQSHLPHPAGKVLLFSCD